MSMKGTVTFRSENITTCELVHEGLTLIAYTVTPRKFENTRSLRLIV